MTRIGFVDHHLANFHADKFLGLLRGPLADHGVEVALAWESDPAKGDWCEENGVPRAESAEQVARECDGVLILAPDNVDQHLRLAQAVLPLGKPTVVDKFLAPTAAEARAIVELANRHSAPLMSASALRFAVEVEAALPELAAAPVTEMMAAGLSTWSLYGVHTLSMVMRIMGHGVRRLVDTGTPTARTVTLDYGDGKRAVVDVRTAANEWDMFGWRFAARTGDRYVGATIADYDGFYTNLMRNVAGFFTTGQPAVSAAEAVTVVKVLEGADQSLQAGGAWVDLA